jgi:hypothetical protein
MKLRIKISTPKGAAENTWNKFKAVLGIGKGKSTYEGYVNDSNDTIYIEVEGNIRECFRIMKNVNIFQHKKNEIIKNKLAQKGLKGMGATNKQLTQLQDLFENDTNIEIVKEATAQELQEYNMTFWDKIKQKFRKVKKC